MSDQANFGENQGHHDSTQPQPKPGGKSVVDGLMEDLEKRRQYGQKKYGQELLTNNGRNHLLDAYQEAMDLVIYLKQQLMESDEAGNSTRRLDWAKAELDRAGLLDKDSDYNGEAGQSTLELMQVFSRQGHSGESARLTLHLFTTLANGGTLTPLTDDPAEWMDVSNGLWQSRRNSACFSKDGGHTWYNVDDKNRTLFPTERQ